MIALLSGLSCIMTLGLVLLQMLKSKVLFYFESPVVLVDSLIT